MPAFAAGKKSRKMKANTIKTKMHQKKKSKQIHWSWSIEEIGAVLSHFSSNIRSQHVPTKKGCEDCLAGIVSMLERRSWKDVKYCVKNHIVFKKMKQ